MVYSYLNDYAYEFVKKTWAHIPAIDAWALAGEFNSIDLCDWLRDPGEGRRKEPYDLIVMYEACSEPSWDVLYWLRDPNTGGGICPMDEMCAIFAARAGNVDVLKFLKNEGLRITPKVFEHAVEHGQIEVVDWIKKLNSMIDIEECNEY
jgi:hypothetical protein